MNRYKHISFKYILYILDPYGIHRKHCYRSTNDKVTRKEHPKTSQSNFNDKYEIKSNTLMVR